MIEEWARRLREKRLIDFISVDARGGFGGVRLTALGQFFVKWAMVEIKAGARANAGLRNFISKIIG